MISPTELQAAADAIRAGKLVAFPTETVYGLGANALDAEAVEKIYQAKQRPATSPLIVHVASIDEARDLASEWLPVAQALAEHFWPGPLTLVVPKQALIPHVITAGLSTVGLRMPAHPIALALIRASGVPIAAPSANRFTELSPTRAEHVRRSLGDQVEIVLDGGPTAVGIESTVVAVTARGVELLRPGTITREQIEAVTGPLIPGEPEGSAEHRSPGQHLRHYQPRTRLVIAQEDELPTIGRGAFLSLQQKPTGHTVIPMQAEPLRYAAELYSVLHDLDRQGFNWIAVEPPPQNSQWEGVWDRLRRAAS